MGNWLPFPMPWEVQDVANDLMHQLQMFALAVILGLVAIVILLKVGGKWRVPLFILFLAPAILILGGFVG